MFLAPTRVISVAVKLSVFSQKILFSTSRNNMRSYQEAIDTLNGLQTNFAVIQQTKQSGNKNMATLLQMFEYSRRVGFDAAEYDKLNIVHVTGTKGKGSTCAFVQSLLAQYKSTSSKISKIGLYTSPHLRSVRERICIDGKPISEELFAKYFFEVYDLYKKTNNDPSLTTELTKDELPGYFKYLTILSFYIFMKEGVDAAVYEVGIGGELDSTNIIHKPLASGVSSIAVDHTFVLGNTLAEISWNKSGIFKAGAPAFSVIQEPESAKVLEQRAKEKLVSKYTVVDVHPLLKDGSVKLGIDGDVQKINASLAVALAFSVFKQLNIPIYDTISNDEIPENINSISEFPQKILDGLEKAHIDGRAQILNDSVNTNLTWYLDGSHTVESIEKSTTWWNQKMIAKKSKSPEAHNNSIRILFFNQQSRNIEELLTTLYKGCEKTVSFENAIFTTNVTWANHKYDINLVSMNVDAAQVDQLSMQKRSKAQWEQLEQESGLATDQKTKLDIFPDIESGTNLVRDLAKKYPEKDIDVFVCGSLHLVGGLLVVLDSAK